MGAKCSVTWRCWAAAYAPKESRSMRLDLLTSKIVRMVQTPEGVDGRWVVNSAGHILGELHRGRAGRWRIVRGPDLGRKGNQRLRVAVQGSGVVLASFSPLIHLCQQRLIESLVSLRTLFPAGLGIVLQACGEQSDRCLVCVLSIGLQLGEMDGQKPAEDVAEDDEH